MVETTNAAGAIISKYSQGQNIDEPLAESTAGTTSLYEQDGLGSVTSLSSSAGALANTYTYDSFGKLTNSSGRSEISGESRWACTLPASFHQGLGMPFE